MNLKTTPFKFIRNGTADEPNPNACIFAAEFQIADDGTPESETFLRVEVETNSTATNSGNGVRLILHSKHGGEREICDGAAEFDDVARLLYGCATVETVKTIVPR